MTLCTQLGEEQDTPESPGMIVPFSFPLVASGSCLPQAPNNYQSMKAELLPGLQVENALQDWPKKLSPSPPLHPCKPFSCLALLKGLHLATCRSICQLSTSERRSNKGSSKCGALNNHFSAGVSSGLVCWGFFSSPWSLTHEGEALFFDSNELLPSLELSFITSACLFWGETAEAKGEVSEKLKFISFWLLLAFVGSNPNRV